MLRVVKLGGSLYSSPHLSAWLAACAKTAGKVVLVPGGGPFADQVRAAQPQLGFDDATAHHLALLAMEQFGLALCGMSVGLRPAATAEVIADLAARGMTPVWLPSAMVLGDRDIRADWSVTSDSLAAWLATQLRAEALALVKHGPDGVADYEPEADAGRVDQAFPGFAKGFGKPVSILGQGNAATLERWMKLDLSGHDNAARPHRLEAQTP